MQTFAWLRPIYINRCITRIPDHSKMIGEILSNLEQEDTREVINITEVNAKLETLITEGNELNQKIEAIIKELGE